MEGQLSWGALRTSVHAEEDLERGADSERLLPETQGEGQRSPRQENDLQREVDSLLTGEVGDFVMEYGKETVMDLIDGFQDVLSFLDIRQNAQLAASVLIFGRRVDELGLAVMVLSVVSCAQRRKAEFFQKHEAYLNQRKFKEDSHLRSLAARALLEQQEEQAERESVLQNALISIAVIAIEDLPSLFFSFLLVSKALTSWTSIQFLNLISTFVIFLIKFSTTLIQLNRMAEKAEPAVQKGLDKLKAANDLESVVLAWRELKAPIRVQITKGRMLEKLPENVRVRWLKEARNYRTARGKFYAFENIGGQAFVEFGGALVDSLPNESPQFSIDKADDWEGKANRIKCHRTHLEGVIDHDDWPEIVDVVGEGPEKEMFVHFENVTLIEEEMPKKPESVCRVFRGPQNIVLSGDWSFGNERALSCFLRLFSEVKTLMWQREGDKKETEKTPMMSMIQPTSEKENAILKLLKKGYKDKEKIPKNWRGWMALATASDSDEEKQSLQTLDLQEQDIGEQGTILMCEALKKYKPPNLKEVILSGSTVGEKGSSALASCLELGLLREVEKLDLGQPKEAAGEKGSCAIEESGLKWARKANQSICSKKERKRTEGEPKEGKSVKSRSSKAQIFGAVFLRRERFLFEAIKKSKAPKLKELNVAGAKIGSEGAETLAEAIEGGAMKGLQRLDVSQNKLEKGKTTRVRQILERKKRSQACQRR
uniref:Uncharacterized protein n=1 Tax=Chromera velia CCMP2878 TaxID=1169474 RepID=A0A0G4FS83_9ALVE|eukprot:Cvel_18513.t1-p1 / transcript=Cvel_18513.t1 / gene=Cvel_18513 / organism=Chromera_velia_CCMP2878 / gene_product=hypothetical protein / transcript_product=hypothetical protein / location=Cvel_scaffold1538:13824-16869(+) / protein_length=710 / sequence_SO=supercontig / SO=protein_coding / is_pseudo=false